MCLTDLHSPTGYEPNDLAEVGNSVQVKPLFFHKTEYDIDLQFRWKHRDSPPEWDLDDEQTRTMLASPLF